jgi:hypothetical protein
MAGLNHGISTLSPAIYRRDSQLGCRNYFLKFIMAGLNHGIRSLNPAIYRRDARRD